MNAVIIAAGVLGLAAAVFFLVDLAVDGVRRRQYLDVVVAAAVVMATVLLLFFYGDTLLQ